MRTQTPPEGGVFIWRESVGRTIRAFWRPFSLRGLLATDGSPVWSPECWAVVLTPVEARHCSEVGRRVGPLVDREVHGGDVRSAV